MQQDELSRQLSVDKGLVARCVKSLEEKGYVRRRQDEKDKRFKYIYLTETAPASSERTAAPVGNMDSSLDQGYG